MQIQAKHILYEDNHLLVIAKWVGVATQGVTDELSLQHLGQAYLKQKYNKPGNVYLGIVSRLDKLTSGVIVFARTSKAAARLSEQIRKGTVEKIYWAVTSGKAPAKNFECRDWLVKSEREQRMQITSSNHQNAQEAILNATVLDRSGQFQLLEIELITGRKHQIRVQLAEREMPVVGDSKYGSPIRFASGIALHARSISFDHPTTKERLTITCPVPESWNRFQMNA